jgi:hypothetical protein
MSARGPFSFVNRPEGNTNRPVVDARSGEPRNEAGSFHEGSAVKPF